MTVRDPIHALYILTLIVCSREGYVTNVKLTSLSRFIDMFILLMFDPTNDTFFVRSPTRL